MAMQTISRYLDGIEAQLCRDGFMTHALRRHLHQLHRVTDDRAAGHRIERLVARYNAPYAGLDLSTQEPAGRA